MKKFLFYILSIVTFTSFLHAEIVNKVVISGNKRVSEETIKIYGEIETNKDFSEKDLNKVLKNLNSTDFFQDIKINIKNNILEIQLTEYPLTNQLIITGEKSTKYKEQIIKLIKLKEKRSFIKSYLSKDIDLIKNLYSAAGYNFSDVEAKVKKIDDENLDLVFIIKRGEKTRISSINFLGNKKVKTKRLLDIIASQEHKFWKVISSNTNLSQNLITLDQRLLLNYYKSLGFYDAKVSSNFAQINKVGNADLTYSIDEGERYTISKISTNVDSVFNKNLFFPLRKDFDKIIGEYYSPFKIKNLLESLDDLIESNNLQFVEHNVEETIVDDSIHVKFNIYEGEKKLVERINIIGNSITNENVIRGELLLDEGDPFTNLNLEKSIAKIKNRNIFRDVKFEVLNGSQNNLKLINIEVEEKPTGEISAGAGIGTNGGSFAAKVSENNWLGEGKKLGFDVQVDKESLSGTVTFSDPNYNFLGNSINYSLSRIDNDKPDQGYKNSLTSAGIGTSFEQYKDTYVSLGVNASHDDLKTEGSASQSLKKQAGTFSELAANYGFSVDKRNRSFKPTSGSIVSVGQTVPFVADNYYIANTISASRYKSFSEDIIGASKFFIASVNSLDDTDVRLNKRKSVSTRRLRGFERNKVGPVDGTDHVGGNYTAALNFEASMPNLLPEATNTDVGFFLDFANVWGVDYDSSIDDSNKIRSSTGAIASWLSPLGPMSFTFAQNISKASTDKTESFNFNLGTTF